MTSPRTKNRFSFQNWSILTKLLIVVIAAVLIPMSVLTYINAQSLRKSLGNEIGTGFESMATGRSSYLVDVLLEQLTLLRGIAVMENIKDCTAAANLRYTKDSRKEIENRLASMDAPWRAAEPESDLVRSIVDTAINPCARQLAKVKSAFPDHVEVFVTDRFGGLVASSGKTSDYFQADEDWWKETFDNGKGMPYLGQPVYDESTHYTALNMATPIYSGDEKEVIGVVRSTFRIDALFDIAAALRFGKSGQVTVVNGEGRLIVNSYVREMGRPMPKDWIDDAASRADRGWFESKGADGEPVLAGYADIGTVRVDRESTASAVRKLGWRLLVHQKESEAFASIADASERSVVSAAVFALCIAVLVFAAARKTLAPISELAALSHKMAGGNLDERLSLDRGDEIGELAEAFNRMADQISEMVRNLEDRIQERTVELSRAKEAAEAATKAKSEFLAGMSHELRTPLNAVIGFSEILDDCTFGPLNEKQKKYVGNVLTGSRHLLQLINDILDISKVEAGKMVLEAEDVELEALFASTEMLFREKVMKHRISLTFFVFEALRNKTFRADPRKLKQVLFNLVSNAVKFTPEGGKVRVTAERADLVETLPADGSIRPSSIRKDDAGKWLRIDVADTGIGIDPKDQERIFWEFEQLGGKAGRQEAGTGLGLSLVQKLTALHRGCVFVQSEGKDKGSIFTVVIPYKAETPSLDAPGASSSIPGEIVERPLVLVVDDNRQAGELIDLYLTESGCRTARAYDGKEALVAAETLKPDLITLDIALPSLDGWEVLSELKLRPTLRDIPVIIVSIIDKRPMGLNLGAVDYFVKPVDKKAFIEGVHRAVRSAGKKEASILVVDDDAPTVELIADRIRAEGFSVMEAYDGKQCLDIVFEKLPDVIILDLLMPGINGFEVVRRLREDSRTIHIPILIYTAKELDEEDRKLLHANLIEIASKSNLSKNDLISTVKKLNKTAHSTQDCSPQEPLKSIGGK